MKAVSTMTAGALGTLALQQSLQPVNGNVQVVAGVTAVVGGASFFTGTFVPLSTMRGYSVSLSDTGFKAVRAVTDSLLVDNTPLLESVNDNLGVIGDAVDVLVGAYNTTDVSDLISDFWPGSTDYPVEFDYKMVGRYVCDPDKVDPSIDDLQLSVSNAWQGIIRIIFGAISQTVEPEMCNLMNVAGKLVYAESAADRMINQVSVGVGEGLDTFIHRINDGGSELSSAVENVLTATQAITASLQKVAQSLNGVDVSIIKVIDLLEDISDVLLGAGRFYFLDGAFSVAQGASGVAVGGLLPLGALEASRIWAQEGSLLTNLRAGGVAPVRSLAPSAAGLSVGLVSGLTTHFVYVKPLDQKLDALKAEINAQLSDDKLEALREASVQLDAAASKLVTLIEAVLEFGDGGIWDEVRQLETMVVGFQDKQPLEDLCNAGTNSYAQTRDASVTLLCDVVTSILNVLEQQLVADDEQHFTAKLSTDLLQSVFKATFDAMDGMASRLLSEANVDVTRLKQATEALSLAALQVTGGLRSALVDVSDAKGKINEDVDGIQSIMRWYLPVMIGILGAGAASMAVLTGFHIVRYRDTESAVSASDASEVAISHGDGEAA